jgi:hypothetical protein
VEKSYVVRERIERELAHAQRQALQAEKNISYYTRLLESYESKEV